MHAPSVVAAVAATVLLGIAGPAGAAHAAAPAPLTAGPPPVAAPAGAPHPAAPGPAAHPAVPVPPPAGRHHDRIPAAALALARRTLPPGDGWASTGGGTSGGAAADATHVALVHNRAELVAALGGDAATNGQNDTPKIVLVSGAIDLSVDAAGRHRDCASYADPDYRLDAYLAAYDPAVWGRTAKPSGPLEDARVRSARTQGDTVKINVGSNTTIVGVHGAHLEHGSLVLAGVHNVIVRNLHLSDAADCFPAWDPTDGDTGNWNSLYDLVSLTGATNVWIDHDTFDDGDNPDAAQPRYFGRPYQVHDGASDIIKASDLVTVSWNRYTDHDKTMLIGSTDTPGVDVGKLRVTVHHNRFDNVLQRAPRVRFGQVDVYDNYYVATDPEYQYSIGVGAQSAVYAQNNFFELSARVPVADVIHYWKGTAVTAIGSLVRTPGHPPVPVDLVAAHNAVYDPDLSPDAGWTPTARTRVDPAWAVPALVSALGGSHG
jgi:pectate lyase